MQGNIVEEGNLLDRIDEEGRKLKVRGIGPAVEGVTQKGVPIVKSLELRALLLLWAYGLSDMPRIFGYPRRGGGARAVDPTMSRFQH
jgi:hypothetical protein